MRKVRVRHPAIGDFAFTVNAKGVVVGRKGGGADIDLGWDSRVSRRHGRFWTEDGQVLYEDLSSRNGSFVGTKRITETRLLVGDAVLLGETSFVVEEGRNDEAPELTAQLVMSGPITLPPPPVVMTVKPGAGTIPNEVTLAEPPPTPEMTLPPRPRVHTPEPETSRIPIEVPTKTDSSKPAPQASAEKTNPPKRGEATAPRRFIGSTQVKLELKDKKALQRVWETELIKGRLFVPTESPPVPGTQVQLFVESPDGDLNLKAQVAQVLDAAKAKSIGTRPGVGLQILDLNGEKKENLLSYLDGRASTLG